MKLLNEIRSSTNAMKKLCAKLYVIGRVGLERVCRDAPAYCVMLIISQRDLRCWIRKGWYRRPVFSRHYSIRPGCSRLRSGEKSQCVHYVSQ